MMKLTSTILLAFSADASGVHDLTHLLPPMQARRRVPHKRVKPAQTTELPYDSSIENGRGWNHHTEEFVAHAFEPYTGGLYRLEHSLDVEFSRKVITEMSQYNKVMRSTSYVSGSGWGMKAKASFALDRSVSMQSKDALFVLLARKELGFEGWSFEQIPAFREQAKKALCDKGVFTPEKFEEFYGTYYVQGVRKAAALDIVVKMETTTSSSDQKVSASLSMSWSGVGKKVSGGSTFSQKVSQQKQSSKVTVHATAFGVDRQFIPDANINNLDEVIENFKEVSEDGSGIALKLIRYDDHKDYIRIQNECGRTFESLERNEDRMDKFVDVAVEAKLFAEEILTKPYTVCGSKLALQGLQIFDDLTTTPEDELTPEAYMEALARLDGIKKAWSSDFDECYVKCSVDYFDRRTNGKACPANRPYCEGYQRNVKWGHCQPTANRKCSIDYVDGLRGVNGVACPEHRPYCEDNECQRTADRKCSIDYADSLMGVKGKACAADRPYCEGAVRNVRWGECKTTADRKCSVDYVDSFKGYKGTACPANRPYCEGYQRGVKWGECRRSADRKCSVGYADGQKGVRGTACPQGRPHCVGWIRNKQWGQCELRAE